MTVIQPYYFILSVHVLTEFSKYTRDWKHFGEQNKVPVLKELTKSLVTNPPKCDYYSLLPRG